MKRMLIKSRASFQGLITSQKLNVALFDHFTWN